jgi:hypothetical protein
MRNSYGRFGFIHVLSTGTTGTISVNLQILIAYLNIGFLGFWIRSFWLPFIIAKVTFMWGAGLTHILHMFQHDNFSPSNTGIIVYWDFFLPIILILLYSLYKRGTDPSR